jgi:hypothetical protein
MPDNEPILTDRTYIDRPSEDVTVIGPGCFASTDRSVLNWEGMNYVQQSSTADLLHRMAETLHALRSSSDSPPCYGCRKEAEALLPVVQAEIDRARVGYVQAPDRETVIRGVLRHVTNASNLPNWMMVPVLGRDMLPFAEGIVDALVAFGVVEVGSTDA